MLSVGTDSVVFGFHLTLLLQQTTVAPSEPAPTSTQPAVSLAPPAPSPAFSLSQGAGGTDSLLVQQQLLLQHQILQLQMGMR